MNKPTKGTRGFLIYDHAARKTLFRVYNQDKSDFTDYSLNTYDLEVVIDDDDSWFYEGDNPKIDYPPQHFLREHHTYKLRTGEEVEFSHWSSDGKYAIVHPPGEPDMQSSFGVLPEEFQCVTVPSTSKRRA